MLMLDKPDDRLFTTDYLPGDVCVLKGAGLAMHPIRLVEAVPVPHCQAVETVIAPRYETDRWSDLMIAAQNGCDASYETLLREVNQWLFRYFRRRLPREIAEDNCQEALLAIHIRKHTYVASGPFGPWLATIARFKWMDHLRRHYREAAFLPEDVEVDDHGHRSLSAIVIARLLDDLKPAQASAIRLVKLAGASVEEAAAATGQSKSLIKVNVHRGLKKMAQQLDGSLLEDPSLGSPLALAITMREADLPTSLG